MNAWSVLGVDANSTEAEAKAAWRAAARRSHPDLGGDVASFKAAHDAWEAIKQAQPPLPSGRAVASESEVAEARPWNHLRAVEHLIEIDGLEVEAMLDEDEATTGVAGPEGVIWLSLDQLEWDGFGVPWSLVDDKIMGDIEELLLVGLDG